MADGGLPNGGPPHKRPPDTVHDLCKREVIFNKHINLDLLLPYLKETNILTSRESYTLSYAATPPENRISQLVTEILPSKGERALEVLKLALLESLEEEGSDGHEFILQEVFGIVNGTIANNFNNDTDREWLVTADKISEESEEFSLFLLNFSGELENGPKEVVRKRLKRIVTYFCHLKVKSGRFLLKESVKTELCSEDVTFAKLFNCLDSSKPPVISHRDVSMLRKFIEVLNVDDSSKMVVDRLHQLLDNYERDSGIMPVSKEPLLSPESASLKVKVSNAHSGNSKLKNGVKRSFFESLKVRFHGSGIGSVIFYWEFPKECYQYLLEGFENVHESKISLQQFRITKVEAQQPHQIYLEMEITDPELMQLSQHQHFVADDIAPEQEKFVMLLIKIDRLVGTHATSFLSVPRKEISRIYSMFEGKSFLAMADQLIGENSLHCYDIFCIQLFLCSLLKWDATEGNKYKKQLVALLKETQDYEPIPTGFPLPQINLRSRTQTVRIISCISGVVVCVSYDVMMTLKYALSRLLNLSLSAFHYSGWSAMENGFQLLWNTSLFNFDRIEASCYKNDVPTHCPTGGLVMINEPDINYPHNIRFTCEITDAQLLLDGSPLLVPDIENSSCDVTRDKLTRVGHICATCFVDYKWAFRLLWLHCFKPCDHQFAGSVCAVFYPDGIGKKPVLCRVRPLGILQKCPDMMRCCKGRKCPKAHSGVELHFWNKLQQGGTSSMSYKRTLGMSKPVKPFQMISLSAIASKLSVSNYCEKFHHLLYWEELQHIEDLKNRCVDSVDVIIYQESATGEGIVLYHNYAAVFGHIIMKDADSAKYVMQASQQVQIQLPQVYAYTPKMCVYADVISFPFKIKGNVFSNLELKHVPIAMNDKNIDLLKQYFSHQFDVAGKENVVIPSIRVQFMIKHWYFQDLHQAVDNVPKVVIQKLFPSVNKPHQKKASFSAYSLIAPFSPDKLQLNAICSLMSAGSELPFILVGPFGTGKTHVLACAAAAIVTEDATAKVLIVTHHNKSVDTFVSKYFGTIESTKCLPATVAPVRITSEYTSEDTVRPYCINVRDPTITMDLLDERRIVITTFITALRFASTEKLPRGYFTHILIDEGAQTREPETIAPLIFADERTKIVIAGDHMQVGPKTLVLGEKANRYGLAESLVERLYNFYYHNHVDEQWVSNLLINYRSHESIMHLSSNLFYDSTLVSKSDSRLHPHTYYPLHFVCTSLSNSSFCNVSDVHPDEAEIILKEVKKYTQPWPSQWGVRKRSVCIVASSRSQVIEFQSRLGDLHSYVVVLPSYDIQGREFQAVFVSTAEATDSSGCSKNPTKSMADQFVFNTVVTRAQSLVVCVGNPYFLFHLENKMHPGKKFWLAYVNSCLECETFVYPSSSFSQADKERLLNIVDINTTYTTQFLGSDDKIIEGYLKSLAKFDEYKRTLAFSKTWKDIHWIDQEASENTEEDKDLSDPLLGPYVKCVIHFQSRYNALARPVDAPSNVIHINGQNNLCGAFHESTVLVKVINSIAAFKKGEKPKLYGKVEKFISLHNATFYCEVDNQNLTQFHPINGRDPKFCNLPTLAKIPKGVAVFDLQSLKDVPRIVQVFPPQIARRRIFILQFLHWNTKYRTPVGMVVGSIAKGYTFSSGERLLRAQYNFDFCETTNIKPLNLTYHNNADEVFAIMPKTKEIFQNAFSVKASDKENIYHVNFYVIDVAGSTEDRQPELSKKRGTSACVKTDKLNEWKHYPMFSSKIMRELAFALGEPRYCFKVSCTLEIDLENGAATCNPIDEPIRKVVGILTKSYTLQEVENYLDDQSKGTFPTLFQAARCLQYQRISVPYNWLFDVLEAPRAQLILKEFSLWANRLVATKLANSTSSSVPLYHKLPLSKEAKQTVYNEHGDTLQTSLHNKYFLPKNGYKPLDDVSINRKFIPLFLEALKNCELDKYLAMLSYDNCFPQLCVASHKFKSIKRVKEFVLCDETDEIDFNRCSHEDDLYTTMFTSPLNNYFDIIVQDMLSEALNLKPPKYSLKELEYVCEKATQDFKRKSEFEENIFNLQLGVTLKAFNHKIDGYVEGANSKNQLTLSFPSHELKTLSENQSSFNVAHLFAIKSSDNLTSPSNSSTSLYEWKVKVASFQGPPSIFTASSIFLTKDKVKDTNTSIDVTLYMASSEEDGSQFNAELDKMRLVGSIEPSTLTVKWKQLINVMDDPENDGCRRAAFNALSHQSRKPTQKELYKQEADKTVFWLGSVKRKVLQKYDMLHVWFGAAQDTALIYPKIQQVEITPFLKVCVQHNSEPEKCFSDVSLAYASKDSYLDIAEYIDLWGQVVIAENAVSSVKTRDVLLLENVYLQWPELEYCCDSYNGDYYKVPTNQFIIMKPPLDFTKSSIEIFDLRRGDLLCVQYEITDKKLDLQMGFVFHMVVERVDESTNSDGSIQGDSNGEESLSDQSPTDDDEEAESSVQDSNDNVEVVLEKGEVQYLLRLPEGVGRISEKFNSVIKTHPTCQVQLLHISPPLRRIYRVVRNLRRSSFLARQIACGNIDVLETLPGSNLFKMEAITAVLTDERVTHLWDKPNKQLSTRQMSTIRNACMSQFSIIHGPPGTGKSMLGAHLAYVFAKLNRELKTNTESEKNKCVVYCGSSNVSVDFVAKMLCDLAQNKQKSKTDKLRVLRIYPRNIEQSVYPSPLEVLYDSDASLASDNMYLKELKQNSLHYKIRYECGALGETIKSLEARFQESKQKDKLASKADRMKYMNAVTKAQDKILSEDIDILICTCNEMASGRVFRNIEPIQVIVDEAAMVTEPESMIPIQHAKQIILLGDHQQLQPKVESRHADKNGLTVSLFQRYVGDIEYKHYFLKEQFRMHQHLCEFPARKFYSKKGLFTNKVTAKEMQEKSKKLKRFWPNSNSLAPFVFCDVIGKEEVTDTEYINKTRVGQESKFNSKEANKIVEIAKVLVMNYGIKQQDILALSPYQAQCRHIHSKLQANKLNGVKCTTVKSSEGNECGIVLLSTVRSQPLEDIENPEALIPDRGWLGENLGFLTDTHVINVGITRCQYGLIIVGNKCLLDYDDTWSELIHFCSNHDNVVRETQFPSRADRERIKGFMVV